jgi:hypothetical protein
MWGLSFEDMAKKAAELQEQAAHAAESLAQVGILLCNRLTNSGEQL